MRANDDELCGVEAIRRDWIDSLIGNLRQRIELKALYVFGSRAQNEHIIWSDYDVCVVSDDFALMKPWDRMELVLSCWQGRRALEAICFTSKEFDRSQTTLTEEIRSKGKQVYP